MNKLKFMQNHKELNDALRPYSVKVETLYIA